MEKGSNVLFTSASVVGVMDGLFRKIIILWHTCCTVMFICEPLLF